MDVFACPKGSPGGRLRCGGNRARDRLDESAKQQPPSGRGTQASERTGSAATSPRRVGSVPGPRPVAVAPPRRRAGAAGTTRQAAKGDDVRGQRDETRCSHAPVLICPAIPRPPGRRKCSTSTPLSALALAAAAAVRTDQLGADHDKGYGSSFLPTHSGLLLFFFNSILTSFLCFVGGCCLVGFFWKEILF